MPSEAAMGDGTCEGRPLPDPRRRDNRLRGVHAQYQGGHLSSCNADAQRFKVYNESERLGAHFLRFTSKKTVNGGARACPGNCSQRRPFENEGWRFRKDGTRVYAHVIVDASTDKNGGLLVFAKITDCWCGTRPTTRSTCATRTARSCEVAQERRFGSAGKSTFRCWDLT